MATTTVTRHNISIPQDSTYVLVVSVVGGPPSIDLYTGSMQIRPSKDSAEVLADLDDTFFTVDALNRQVVLELTDEETGSYDWSGNAVYDMYIEGPSGDRWRLIEGLATLNRTVTREV